MRHWTGLLLLLLSCAAWAHKPSDSYLTLKVDGAQVAGQWDIALRDLDFAIGLDANDDGAITWGELRARRGEVSAYALARLKFASGGVPCPARATGHLVDQHSDGAYAVLRFAAECPDRIETLRISYGLLFDLDPQHKGLLRLEAAGRTVTGIFSLDKPTLELKLGEVSRFSQFLEYGEHGVWHIWIGYDHILFLLSLLLPAVLHRTHKHWEPVATFGEGFWDVFRIVTSFTVAHSITLSLAALGVIELPSRLVESAIAASVLLAAINNLLLMVIGRRWVVAFVFGLVHGFGFASVLADLGLPREALLLALLGFNLGVEVGQLAIVSVFLPLAYALRRTWFYQRLLLVGGSLAIAAVAASWMAERILDVKFLPF